MTTKEKVDYYRCVTQGDLFAFVNRCRYDMAIFTKNYFLSNFCLRQMDSKYSIHQQQYDELLASYVFDEVYCPKIDEKSNILDYDLVWWVGYITRKWVIDSRITSCEIIKEFSFNDIASAYNGFHTLDDDVAVDRLEELRRMRAMRTSQE